MFKKICIITLFIFSFTLHGMEADQPSSDGESVASDVTWASEDFTFDPQEFLDSKDEPNQAELENLAAAQEELDEEIENYDQLNNFIEKEKKFIDSGFVKGKQRE